MPGQSQAIASRLLTRVVPSRRRKAALEKQTREQQHDRQAAEAEEAAKRYQTILGSRLALVDTVLSSTTDASRSAELELVRSVTLLKLRISLIDGLAGDYSNSDRRYEMRLMREIYPHIAAVQKTGLQERYRATRAALIINNGLTVDSGDIDADIRRLNQP